MTNRLAFYLSVMVLLVVTAYACSNPAQADNEAERISIKDTYGNGLVTFYIIEVDGIEYLAQRQGGICPLVR